MTKSNKKRITIITPCFNAEKYIDETVLSVLSNRAVMNNDISLEYYLCDGDSTDTTVDKLEKIVSTVTLPNVDMHIISENDAGMYDALAKGLQKSTGDIIAYINAGDYYSPHAFEIVNEIFQYNHIHWLTGLTVRYNEKSHMTEVALPWKYRNKFIQYGFYNSKLLNFIQQESTFWDSRLNEAIDFEVLKRFKYAGDYYLWKSFSKKATLYIVEAWLGGFKYHAGQLSSDKESYHHELLRLSDKARFFDRIAAYLDQFLWMTPTGIKRILNAKTLIRYDHNQQKYRAPR